MNKKTNTKKRGRSQDIFRKKAHLLLQIPEIPTTEVCQFVYGTKAKKSTLNQKKTGVSPLFFEESCKIIEYYGNVSDRIDEIING
jgi:hypothetical protein|tara:strand:- start:974 stop:1228 length:255 start_codon:yes stop_codon:yes gene_type:complete